MNAVEQLPLLSRLREVIPDDYQRQTALKCKSRTHAIRKCVEISTVENHKEIYGPLGIDQAQWSRIWAGTAFLNPDLKFQLMEVCGNDVPVLYDGLVRGYELTRIKSSLEAENAKLRQELEDERRVVLRLGAMLRNQP
jgi:hypothetical protein